MGARALFIGARGTGNQERRYELLAGIAKGGMGEVFLAVMHRPGRPPEKVIIKRLLEELRSDGAHLAMFKSEAEVMHRLDHPNIVRILDEPVIDDTPCLAIQYVHGRSVAQIITRAISANRTIPVPVVLHIMTAVMRGLAHVHGARLEGGEPLRLVHRDLTPGNLLVSFAGDTKITDFGISKSQMSRVATTLGIVKGKARYLAPEQIVGKPASPASDIFSCACVVVEMLTLVPIFERKTVAKTLHAIVHGERAKLSELLEGRAPEFSALLERALATDPRERPPGAPALALELERLARSLAPPPSHADVAAFMQSLFGGSEEPWEVAAREHQRPELEEATVAIHKDKEPERVSAPLVAVEIDEGSALQGVSETDTAAPIALEGQTEIARTLPSPRPALATARPIAKTRPPRPVTPTRAPSHARPVEIILALGLGSWVGVAATLLFQGTRDAPHASLPVSANASTEKRERTIDRLAPPPSWVPTLSSTTSTPASTASTTATMAPSVAIPEWAYVDILYPRGARVRVDGAALDSRVPIRGLALSPGAHLVQLSKGRFKRALHIELDADEHRVLEVPRRRRRARGE